MDQVVPILIFGYPLKGQFMQQGNEMSELLVNKLLESFDELDRCISRTRAKLSEKTDISEDIMARVDQYSDIVAKQRDLAHGLRRFLTEQNWDEVTRHVRLINGLSAMIRDDARSILSQAIGQQAEVDEKPLPV